ncbi:MAG: tetratricopeptide repeat protein [Pelagibacteraceae bacterium]
MNQNILKRFIIICGISTFVMFSVWAIVSSFMNRPPGDYETEVCDNRLKDKLWDEAIEAANKGLEINPDHRGAMMCRALANLNKKKYDLATKQFTDVINFLKNTLTKDDLTGRGALAAAYANRGIIKDRLGKHKLALDDYIKALETDSDSVGGPGLGHKIIYMINKPSSIRDRAQYIYEQLQLPEDKRLLSDPEQDAEQRMHKPGKL